MIIIQDQQEGLPFIFDWVVPKPIIEVKHLKTGDYSIKGMEDQITIERKSLIDLFGSLGNGRDREERKFKRMSKMKFAAFIIEADLNTILRNPPVYSDMKPKSVYRTLISWSIKYNVHVWACPNRAFAEKTTYLLLKKFWEVNYETDTE